MLICSVIHIVDRVACFFEAAILFVLVLLEFYELPAVLDFDFS